MDPTIRILGAISLWSIEVIMQLRVYALFDCSKKVSSLTFGTWRTAYLTWTPGSRIQRSDVHSVYHRLSRTLNLQCPREGSPDCLCRSTPSPWLSSHQWGHWMGSVAPWYAVVGHYFGLRLTVPSQHRYTKPSYLASSCTRARDRSR